MGLVSRLRRLFERNPLVLRRRRRHETDDERAARKYWDEQVAEDHARRGVDDKHA